MQCHLGLYLAVRCDLTLELFSRGLASEDANQHPQRFVAMSAAHAAVLRVEAVGCVCFENGS